ncbi:MmcQ/YjbR family DNA-binding protein [Shinella sp. BYT-45]|uniref:MmcQ/YjbR family DNA-binding protein n=1 Tax=Shinella sp. BYT-45 TaxID=3377377 RepID=UPI00397F88CE
MVSDDLIAMALGMPGARESAHFGKRDFRVGEKVFMTLPEPGRAVLKFTPDQQLMVLETDPGLCAPVPGGWGLKGWTSLYFGDADSERVRDLIGTAWRNVAPKKLVAASLH